MSEVNINEKELVKQIKSSKYRLIWSVQDEVHYITNRHWVVRFKELPTIVLTAMFSVFAEIPENNSSILMSSGIPSKLKPPVDIRKVMDEKRIERPGMITEVLVQHGNELLRVIECSGEYVYVKENYIKIVEKQEPVCTGEFNPVIFCNGDFLILPVRVKQVTCKQVVQDLLAING